MTYWLKRARNVLIHENVRRFSIIRYMFGPTYEYIWKIGILVRHSFKLEAVYRFLFLTLHRLLLSLLHIPLAFNLVLNTSSTITPYLFLYSPEAKIVGKPIILCGKTDAIGTVVAASLKPGYEGPYMQFLSSASIFPPAGQRPVADSDMDSYPLCHDTQSGGGTDSRHSQRRSQLPPTRSWAARITQRSPSV
jgi:hypothetical protein